jgi:hypothetical protein
MRLCLYDAAFAALAQVAPSRGRMAISYLTLFGAFASSVFWVVGHALNERLRWRQTLVAFALINLVVCAVFAWTVERWGWGTGRLSLLVSCGASWPVFRSAMVRRWRACVCALSDWIS